MIVVDSSAIIAALDSADRHHEAVRRWLDAEEDDLVTTPLVVAEVDYVVGARGGRMAQQAFRDDLLAGGYLVEWWPGALSAVVPVAETYADNALGLTDASLVVLAERVETTDIATFDQRHFRSVRPTWGGDAFRLIPIDL
ncbi:MAG TPA: PIN domain-containing protein [Thermoleophilaceae bacterium]